MRHFTRHLFSIAANVFVFVLALIWMGCGGDASRVINPDYRQVPIADDQQIGADFLEPKVVASLGIRELWVEDCMGDNHCYRTRYTFNSCGKVDTVFPAMVASVWTFKYDDQCRLLSKESKGFVRYEYHYLDGDSIVEEAISLYSSANADGVSLSKYKRLYAPLDRSNGSGQQVVNDTIDGLDFPCGEHYAGPIRCETTFDPQGLILYESYYDMSQRNLVQTSYRYFDGQKKEFIW
jgi:hypothetical protein